MNRLKLGDLLERLGGKLIAGSVESVIAGVEDIPLATGQDLVFAEDAASATQALASKAGTVVLKPGCVEAYPDESAKSIVETAQPRLWFARVAHLLTPPLPVCGVHPSAVIGENVELGLDVTIGACAVIGDHASIGAGSRIDAGAVIEPYVSIGENCHIHPRVTIYHGTSIGNRVIVYAGAVLGADGFGYVRDAATGAYTQFPQLGTLVIEDEVEIGANSTIDRGALRQTRIGRGTKIDNLVHIGHNCEIGKNVILVSLTGISGSCTVGDGAVIAGQVGLGDHAHVGPGVILGGQAGVLPHKTVSNDGHKPGTVFWGTPARPLQQVLRELAVLAGLAKKAQRGHQA